MSAHGSSHRKRSSGRAYYCTLHPFVDNRGLTAVKVLHWPGHTEREAGAGRTVRPNVGLCWLQTTAGHSPFPYRRRQWAKNRTVPSVFGRNIIAHQGWYAISKIGVYSPYVLLSRLIQCKSKGHSRNERPISGPIGIQMVDKFLFPYYRQ